MPLDRRISWVPLGTTGHQPMNCYLVADDGGATMVDTGFALFGPAILGQLEMVLQPGAALTVFLTRAEYESVGNLALLNSVHPVERLVTGGVVNMFDAYSEVAGFAELRSRQDLLARMPAGESVAVAGSDRLEVISAPLRILATYWLYDRWTRTLFSSDSFAYTTLTSPDDELVITSENDLTSYETIASHTNARFDWLPGARTEEVRKQITRIFDDRPIEAIAPSHGCILKGASVVRRHFNTLLQALEEDDERAQAAAQARLAGKR